MDTNAIARAIAGLCECCSTGCDCGCVDACPRHRPRCGAVWRAGDLALRCVRAPGHRGRHDTGRQDLDPGHVHARWTDDVARDAYAAAAYADDADDAAYAARVTRLAECAALVRARIPYEVFHAAWQASLPREEG